MATPGIVALSCAADRNRAVESMHVARAVLAEAVENLSEAEVQRARAQLEAGLLMSMESAQGRADQMARSIEVFGRILSTRGAARPDSCRRRSQPHARPARRCSTAAPPSPRSARSSHWRRDRTRNDRRRALG